MSHVLFSVLECNFVYTMLLPRINIQNSRQWEKRKQRERERERERERQRERDRERESKYVYSILLITNGFISSHFASNLLSHEIQGDMVIIKNI